MILEYHEGLVRKILSKMASKNFGLIIGIVIIVLVLGFMFFFSNFSVKETLFGKSISGLDEGSSDYDICLSICEEACEEEVSCLERCGCDVYLA